MKTRFSRSVFVSLAACLLIAGPIWAWIEEYKSGIIWPSPPVVDPGVAPATVGGPASPPADAIVLFGGEDMSAWEGGDQWTIENGEAIVGGNGATTKQSFGDCQLHLEFATPVEVSGEGQGRGNSGVYFMGQYEVQILDSYNNETYFDGQCGAIYKQQPPTVNVCRKPGEWQTYDIIFEAPRFNAEGGLERPAYMTVLHNGVLIHNHFELQGITSYTEAASYKAHPEKLPIHLQNHGNPVRFRNIWIRENIAPLIGQAP
jgi:hypothetical protein